MGSESDHKIIFGQMTIVDSILMAKFFGEMERFTFGYSSTNSILLVSKSNSNTFVSENKTRWDVDARYSKGSFLFRYLEMIGSYFHIVSILVIREKGTLRRLKRLSHK